MKRFLTLAFVLWGAVASAQTPYVATEQITVTDTAGGLTAATINLGNGHPQANYAICRLQTAEIRIRIDGTAPSSTVGTQVEPNDTILLARNDTLSRFSAVRTGTDSGVLNCTYLDLAPAGAPALAIVSASANGVSDIDTSATLNAITSNTGSMLTELQGLRADLNPDAEHDIAALTKGPQIMGYASTTAPTVVTAGDAVRAWMTLNGATVIKDSDYVADVAEGAASSGTVPPVGGIVEDALSGMTLLADGNRFQLHGDKDGVLNVRTYGSLADLANSGAVDVSAGSSTSALSAAGAGVKYYVTSVVCSNPVAGTDVLIDIRDGTAGSVKITIPCPAGGAVYNPPTPIPGFTANTAVAVDPSAGSTGLTVTVLAFKSKM